MKTYRSLLLLTALTVSTLLFSQSATISNALPRLDESGKIVDAHDGRLIKFGDAYYWYGTAYGTTNGFVTSNHYVVYKSDDLMAWRRVGKLLPEAPEGVYYRPHVIYNPKTGKYVLWYNWYPKLWDGQFGVAVSDTPEGPFEIVATDVEMHNSRFGLGDFGLFVDKDGSGYISYNTIQDHQVSVERLSDDFLSSAGENGGVIAKHVEAGTQFYRDGKYYLLTDYTCCFCNEGSGARVYVADRPLGPYTFTGNINRYPGRPSAWLTDGDVRGSRYETLQVDSVNQEYVELQTVEPKTVDRITVTTFTGNRPANCGDVSNPRVHPPIVEPDFRLWSWQYDEWVEIENAEVENESAALRERYTYSIPATTSNRFRVTVGELSRDVDRIYLTEVKLSFAGADYDHRQATAYVGGPKISRRPVIPAQQAYVMELPTADGTEFFWIGDLWGSASDNVKGHDYQYWSAPLEFHEDGTIQPMRWADSWQVELKK